MTGQFELNGYSYRVLPSGSVQFWDGLRWSYSGLGHLDEIKKNASHTTGDGYISHLSRQFLEIYNRITVKHPVEVF